MRSEADEQKRLTNKELLNEVLRANSGVLPQLHPQANATGPVYFVDGEIVSVMRTSGEVQLMRVHKVQGVQVTLRPYKAKESNERV